MNKKTETQKETETRDKLGWYYHRISSMSVPEIAYRLRWKLRQGVFYRLKAMTDVRENVHLTADNAGDRILSKRELFEHFRKQDRQKPVFQKPLFPSLPSVDRKDYQANFSEKRLLELADRYCKKQFSIYEFKNISRKTKKGDVDWLTDFKSKKKWPLCFEGDIYHNTKKMSIRYLWELNSMLHLYTLGKAYFLTKKEKYAQAVLDDILSWIEQNPYLHGPNWLSPLEQGIRIVSWSWALYFIRYSKAINQENFGIITRYIYLKAEYIYHNLSLYSSANNHLIGELAGLAVAGNCFPWLRHSKTWRDKAYNMLYAELGRQFHADGVPAEQAMNYGLFTMDFYLQVYLALGTEAVMTRKLPDKFLNYVDKVAEFLINMMDSKANMPNMGDSDEARVTELNLPGFFDADAGNNYLSFLNTAAMLLNKPEYLRYSKGLDEKSYWLLGKKSISAYNKLNKVCKQKMQSVHDSVLFPKGGYTVMRSMANNESNKYHLVFDHGPLGYLSIAAHGHADSLSVLLNINGKEFLTDPGTYVYHEGAEWRDYFRSTAAHNTITIDDKYQSEIKGVSIWGRKANTKLLRYKDSKQEAVVAACHDGYTRLPQAVVHERKLVHKKKEKTFTITDTLKGKGKHKITLCFNLHPDVKIKTSKTTKIGKANKNELVLSRGDDKIRVILDKRLKVSLHKGETIEANGRIAGWYSPQFGVKVPCFTIKAEFAGSVAGELKFESRIKIN